MDYLHPLLKAAGFVALLATGVHVDAASEPETEFECLAYNIYWEARSESTAGMYAVAEVTLRRVRDPRFPNTICGVVKQPNQFSWYWDGKSDVPRNINAYKNAEHVAFKALGSWSHIELVNDAVFYMNPDKASENGKRFFMKLTYVHTIGNHEFYK